VSFTDQFWGPFADDINTLIIDESTDAEQERLNRAIKQLNIQKLNYHIQFLCSKLNKVSYMITSLTGDLSLFILKINTLQNLNILYSTV
jgi:hypothetical protein